MPGAAESHRSPTARSYWSTTTDEQLKRRKEGLFAQRVSLPVRRLAGVSGCPGVTVIRGADRRIRHAKRRRPGRPLGYASVVPLSPDQASVIPVYLRGRGLQMIAKRVQAGRDETGMLAQVQWLSANAGPVGDAFAAAIP